MKLDPYQRKAAEQNCDYSIIIAGAGTGKTYTLLGRIEYLTKKVGLKPEEILVISYTNETVQDFIKKCKQHLDLPIQVLTFHKFAIYLLKLAKIDYHLCDSGLLSYIIQEFIESMGEQNRLLKKLIYKSKPFSYLFGTDSYHLWKKELVHQLETFLSLCHAKGYHTDFMKQLSFQIKGRKKAFLQLAIITSFIYEAEKSSQLFLDFDDLILNATLNVDKIDKNKFPFKHILIDEFQDSSLSRIILLKEVALFFHIQFTVVGDDCQSIYQFSGTETNCFDVLESYFSNIHYFFLKYTYRNSQQLITLANHFIQKNPAQIKKEVLSFLDEDFPIEIFFYRRTSSIYRMLQIILIQNPDKNILFLGRNSFDWKHYFSSQEIVWIDNKHFQLKRFIDHIFTYLTVHQSKGLEADIVVLLHLENSLYGFPNKIKPYFFHQYLFTKESILFEEERRLFYVALTRTKSKFFLVTPISQPSIFVKEIIHDHKKQLVIRYF